MGRMGGRMGNHQAESLAEKRQRRERLEELDDCSTLCFPKKKISNMEAEQESQGPQRQIIQKTNIPYQSKSDDCSNLGQVVISTVWCVLTFCK